MPVLLPAQMHAAMPAQLLVQMLAAADGVLEIEREVGSGVFVSGSDAYDLLFEERKPAAALGKLSRLSIEAPIYSQALEISDPGRLSARIHFLQSAARIPGVVKPRSHARSCGPHYIDSLCCGMAVAAIALKNLLIGQ
jgi:hypothetical protein